MLSKLGMITRLCALGYSIFLALGASQMGPLRPVQIPPRLFICDLFPDLRKWPGTIVVIEGVAQDTRHSLSIVDSGCKARFEENGLRWPPALNLEIQDSQSSHRKMKADISVERFLTRMTNLRHSTKAGVVSARVVIRGVLEVKDTYSNFHVKGIPTGGFGNFGACPAQLVMLEVLEYSEPTVGLGGPTRPK